MKKLATALLACALAAIAVVYVANQKSVGIQGPGALRAVGDGALWLSVDEEIWVLDRQGERTARVPAGALGLSEAVANIVPAPGGQVLLSSRGDVDWQLVDPAKLARVRTLHPQWPAELSEHARRAIHLAVSPEGDVAVATGGGHTVLLFDREGRMKARTAPDTFHFTNGLWWSPEGWWTTDTNRFALRLLDPVTLAVRRSVQLPPAPPGHPWIGEAIPSQGEPRAGSTEAPLATLTRLGRLMEPGYVVDVFPDGSQQAFHRDVIPQLRDIAWFDGHLLAIDGESFTLRRFNAVRHESLPFGSAQLRGELARLQADRAFWRKLGSRYAFAVAAFLLLAGIAAYVRHRRLEARALIATREGGQTVTLRPSLRELMRANREAAGLPLRVRLAIVGVIVFVVFPLVHWWLLGTSLRDPVRSLLLLLQVLVVLAVPLVVRDLVVLRRRIGDPALEPAFNYPAIEWLRAYDDFDRVKLEGEVPRETVYLPGWHPRWLLVTNRRILLFVVSVRDRRLRSEWPRRAIVFAGSPAEMPAPPAWWRRLVLPPNLVLTFTTGTTLYLRCASEVTARRVAQLLMASPALPDEDAMPVAVPPPPRRRWHEALVSFVVPGAGQWLQGRFATGTVLFTAAILLCIYGWAPVAWALQGPKMDVSTRSILHAILAFLVMPLVASSDAWRFSGARK